MRQVILTSFLEGTIKKKSCLLQHCISFDMQRLGTGVSIATSKANQEFSRRTLISLSNI